MKKTPANPETGGDTVQQTEVLRVSGVLEACLYAHDLDRAECFYRDVVGLTVFSPANGRDVFFRCGQGMFLIFNPERTRLQDSDVPAHGAIGSGHVAFGVPESDLESWRRRLADHGVAIEKEIRWPQGGRSIYFRDPAGNSVELATPKLWGIQDES